jgi:hypothetical protein
MTQFPCCSPARRRPKLFADLPLREGIKLFLYWLIKYESEADIAILTGYPQSNLNASIHEFIGLLPTFCRETIRM